MKWSKLKKNVEILFADSVKGRVELRSTRYRGTHDEEGRGYITFDKDEVFSACTLTFYSVEAKLQSLILKGEDASPNEVHSKARAELSSDGLFNQYGYYDALNEYCQSSIEQSLASENVLLRCLSMLDSRFGKRRIKSFDVLSEHPLVVLFFKIRCKCEGLQYDAC